jgi:hypothetical protein
MLALLVFYQVLSPEQADLELGTDADLSDSVDLEEDTLQMGRNSALFREWHVWDAIEASPPKSIAVTVVLWSSLDEQYAVEGWQRIGNRDEADSFAAAVDG